MCNATIELEILYRLPLPWSTRQALDNPLGPQLPPHHPVCNLCCLTAFALKDVGPLLREPSPDAQECPSVMPHCVAYRSWPCCGRNTDCVDASELCYWQLRLNDKRPSLQVEAAEVAVQPQQQEQQRQQQQEWFDVMEEIAVGGERLQPDVPAEMPVLEQR